MRRVAEVIYVVPEEREAYMNAHLNPSERVAQILWIHPKSVLLCSERCAAPLL